MPTNSIALGNCIESAAESTEYFKESILPRYIRNPRSLRSWENSKMPGFGPEVISDGDLKNLVAYLKEMAIEKGQN